MPAAKLMTDGVVIPMPNQYRYDSASNSIYFGTLDAAGGPCANKYDRTFQLLQTYNLHPQFGADNHNVPQVWPLRSDTPGGLAGRLLAVYPGHAAASYSRLSTTAYDVRAWGSEVQIESGVSTNAQTFVQFHQGDADADRRVFMHYSQGISASNYNWGYRTTTDGGVTWSSYNIVLVHVFGKTPIVRFCYDPANVNRLHWFYNLNLPSGLDASLYHFYSEIQSDGSLLFYKTDGTAITMPVGGFVDASLFTLITATNSCSLDCCVFAGKPSVIYDTWSSGGTSDSLRFDTYNLAAWTGSAWTNEVITPANDASYAGPTYLDWAEAGLPPWCCFDPNDQTSVYASLAFASNFTFGNGADQQATAGRLTDTRLQKWTKTAGTWAKVEDVSGNTGNENIFAHPVPGLSPTVILWNQGTFTSSTSWATDVWAAPGLALNSAKNSVLAWAPTKAPLNAQAYYSLYEGTGGAGATIHDLSGTYDGVLAGTPTWGSDSYGPNLSGFSTANYLTAHSLGAAFSAAPYPKGIAILAANSGTTAGDLFAFTNVSSSNPLYRIIFNNGGTNTLTFFLRGNAAVSVNVTTATINDGNYHVWQVQSNAVNSHFGYRDGVQIMSSGVNLGSGGSPATAPVFDRFALGAFFRTAPALSPFQGKIAACVVFWGAVADPQYVYRDLISGQFGGSYAYATASTSSPAALLMGF